MRITDHLLCAISPSLVVPKKEWLVAWRQKERSIFISSVRIASACLFFIYSLHFFLVDIPEHKEPVSWYIWYRFSVAGTGLITFSLTLTKIFKRSRYSWIVAFCCFAYTVHMQGQSMIMRAQVPFFYVPLFAFLGTYALRLPMLSSIVSFLLILCFSHASFTCRPNETHHMVSASIVAAICLAMLRTRMGKDLESFVLARKHQEIQQKLIEAQIALSDQLRTFLPQELFRRVNGLIERRRYSPLQALDEVLRPKNTLAALLYSDVRGFTTLSKRGSSVLMSAIFPAQKASTDVVDRNSGISSLHGDLLFSYFDLDNPIESIIAAMRSGLELYEVTKEINERDISQCSSIQRYCIITFGSVIVGNIGGSEGARHITAIGTPVNLASRIDALTKSPAIAKILNDYPIILSKECSELCRTVFPLLRMDEIKLNDFGINIRDFYDETNIYLVRQSENNIATLKGDPDRSSAAIYIKTRYLTSIGTNEEPEVSDIVRLIA